MKELIYNNIGAVLQLDKHGELVQKRMKAAKVCDGLSITAPDRTQFVSLVIEYNGVKWVEHTIPAERVNVECLTKRMPAILASIEGGKLLELNDYHKEMHRRIFTPDAPAIMELKQPERKKPAPVQNEDGTICAKVLQYKNDGNTLTEKAETLTKFADGVYYNREQDAWDNWRYVIFFEDNGVFWYSLRALTENQFNNPQERERLIDLRNNFRAYIKETAQNNGFIRSLEIEVFNRLGEDTAPLVASREAYLKHREDEERKRAEEAALREQQRRQAEERRKAELLADGKEKLMANKAVTVEQIELLAEAVGYKIHIRTIGFMREKVSEVTLKENGAVSVYGRKLTQRNISGTADVLREIAARIKAQAEKEAQQPVMPTEVPQISTGAAEVANVSAEDDKREIKHISEIMETCRLLDDNGEMTDEYKYYNWLAYVNCVSYQTIAEKALTEAWINIFQAAYRRGKGHVLAMNKLGELVDTVFTSSVQPVNNSDNLPQPPKQAPQSRKTSPEANYATPTPKARETARKRQISEVRKFRTTYTISCSSTKRLSANSPPIGNP